MKSSICILISFFCFINIYADAGYLGSVTSGPSPVIAEGEHPYIEMRAEEVIIEINSEIVEYDDWEKRLYNATITASFLFVNNGEEDRVLMAMPLDISTPFVPNLYNYLEQDSTFNPGVVKIDGEEVEVKLLFYILCREWTFDELSWEEVSLNIDPLFKDQPEIGQGVYFRNFYVEIDKKTGHYIHNYINPEAALAYWEVDFKPGESHIVEYSEKYNLTSDYNDQMFRLTYPLFTGATWAGNIGYGKISVLFNNESDRENLKFYYGIGLPEPVEIQDYHVQISEELDTFQEFRNSLLKNYEDRIFSNALIWEFKNLEPSPSDFSFCSFYPDIGDIGASYLSSFVEEEHILENNITLPWVQSRIYLIIGSYDPDYYFCVQPEGYSVFERPDGNILNAALNISMFSSVRSLERKGRWINGYIKSFINNIEFEGWIPIYILDDMNLVKPVLMPYINSDYEDPDQ